MALPVSFRWPEEFVAAIDERRGDVPRSVFVRRAVEAAMGARTKAPQTSEPTEAAPATATANPPAEGAASAGLAVGRPSSPRPSGGPGNDKPLRPMTAEEVRAAKRAQTEAWRQR